MKLVTNSEYKLLTDTIAYWQRLFEAERDRADRAVDQLVEMSGRAPVSAPARAEYAAKKDAREKLQESLSEIFMEESDVEATEQAKEDLSIAAKELAARHDSTLPA